MVEPVHDNLKRLFDKFGREAIDSIGSGARFNVDGVEFVCKYHQGSTARRFYIVKGLPLIERYRALCEEFAGGTIVDLGIAEGGSTALLALLARPRDLIAIDLEARPLAALADFIAERGLSDSVHPHYGVDQSDRERLSQIIDADLSGRPIDLVIDDCSHEYGPTRSSFETLFPRLRPGGMYVIEDWNADHVWNDALRAAWAASQEHPDHAERVEEAKRRRADPSTPQLAPRDPLSRLAVELLVARSSRTDLIAEVSVNEFWIVVRRGPGEIEPASFRLSDHYHDYFNFVPPLRAPA